MIFKVLVSGRPPPCLTWYKDKEEICLNSAQDILDDGSLNIPSVGLKLEGVYKLVANNSVGRAEKLVRLTVQAEEERMAEEDGWKAGNLVPTIPVAEFGNYMTEHHAGNCRGLLEQYKVMKMNVWHLYHLVNSLPPFIPTHILLYDYSVL